VGSRENGNPKKDLRPPFFGSFFDFVELSPLRRSSVGRAKDEQKKNCFKTKKVEGMRREASYKQSLSK
jgi:hypothetical protein